MSTLLPFLSVFCLGDPWRNCWNETVNLTAPNFSKGDSLYLKFSESEEPCSYFTVIYKTIFWDFFIFFKQPPKTTILSFFLKSRYFHLDGHRKMCLGTFLETYVGFQKNVVLQLFSKYYQSYINLKVTSS